MSKTSYMRGLQNFISDIRQAQNKEQEQRRVEKELAKIRASFGDEKALSGYDRRKYVWKLLYIYMLGYDITFGHKQAADLIAQPKYKDKQVGYMACALLLRENDEFLRLTLNAVRTDLISRNEAFETLALSFIGSVGGSEMADALTQDVIKVLSSGAARPLVKKRAALALLRLIRKTSADQQVVTADTFSPVLNALLDERDLGLLLSTITLLQGICARNGAAGYEGAQPRLIKVLERLTMHREREVAPEYLYYGIPSPWLQCKCLRVLQFFPPPEAVAERTTLNTILHGIIESVGTGDVAKAANPNKANALHGILFEAISLALQHDVDHNLLTTCVTVLGKFLSAKEPNVKYLALETLSRLSLFPDILEAIRTHQETITGSLKDVDVSIRKRAMDLLFTMCDTSCAEELVKEMLAYLVVADFSLREELVLKIAILAEKFAPSVQWYVDVALQLLESAGDYVGEDIWHRVVQLVTNNPAMQQYAARNVVEVLKRGVSHESLICTAAYILGEFGRLITAEVPPPEQFKLLHAVFPAASQPTKGLLMTAFIKIYLLAPQDAALRAEVLGLFDRYQKFMDAELQQRAVEYLRIAASPAAAAQHYLLPMPKWEERESSLLKRLQQVEGVDADIGAGMTSPPGMRRTLSASGGADGAPMSAAGTGITKLVVGGPIADEPPAPEPPPPPPAEPPVDLLGGDSPLAPKPAEAANGTAGPARPKDPADILADLLTTPGDAAAAAAAAAGAGAAAGTAAAAHAMAQQPQVAAGQQPQQQQQPYAPGPGYPPQYTGASVTQYPGAPIPPGGLPTGGGHYPGAYPPQHTGGMPPYPPQYTGGGAPPSYPPQYTGVSAGYTGQYTGASAGYTGQGAYPGAPAYGPSPSFANVPLLGGGYQPQPSFNAAGGGGPPAGIPPTPGYGIPPAQQQQQQHYPAAGPTGGSYASGPSYSAASYGTPATPGYPPAAPPAAVPPSAGPTGASTASAASASQPTTHYEPAKLTGSVDQWYNNLLVKDRGILYEDQYLQVGVQSRYTGSHGQVVLFLGNKHAEGALMGVSITVNAPAGLQVLVGPLPQSLQPKQQLQVVVQTLALSPYSGAPAMQLAYQLPGMQVRQDLRLPVMPHKFIVPEPNIPKELFFEQWKMCGAPPGKCQEMVERSTPLTSPSVVAVTKLANLGGEHGYLDPNPSNEAGAGYFTCGTQGAEQRILVMARIEGNPQNMAQFRVTVASSAPQLSAAVKDLLVVHLKSVAA